MIYQFKIVQMNLIIKNLVKYRISMQPSIKTRYIEYKDGPAESMSVSQRQIIVPQDHFLMKIKAVGINRAQTLQRLGRYTVTKQVEKYLGLEACGQIIDPNTKQVSFDGMALLSGGSYAQYAVIPKCHVMELPQNLTYVQGAAITQAWLTAFQIIGIAELKQGQDVIIYAGASGVGTAAIQICKVLKINAFAVVSSEEKRKLCLQVGAKSCVLYKNNEKWDQELIALNNNKRFQAVLDPVGVSNLDRTINLLEVDGHWVLYGLMSGVKAQVNFMKIMQKRIALHTTLLKTRSLQYKKNLIQNFSEKILPSFEKDAKNIRPIIDSVIKTDFTSPNAFIQAHKKMESNLNAGKIIIELI